MAERDSPAAPTDEPTERFALFRYSTFNLGDEIQSIAARRYLPRVDCYVDRDFVSRTRLPYDVKLIANGWYTNRPENWPPDNPRVTPLLISVHLSGAAGSDIDRLLAPDSLDYLTRHGPVGCRDLATMRLLEGSGVPAYFSGCLTLTLQPRRQLPKERILFVDMLPETLDLVPRNLRSRVTTLTRNKPHDRFLRRHRRWRLVRFRMAESLLDAYANAHLVVTSKLHCALPCRAFGTPVVYVPGNVDDPRLGGLTEFLHTYSRDEFRSVAPSMDWETPLPNPGDITPLVDALTERCRAFVEGTDQLA